eukprot:UN12500
MHTSAVYDMDDLLILAQGFRSPEGPNKIAKDSVDKLYDLYGIGTHWRKALSQFSYKCNIVFTIKELQPFFLVQQPKSSFHFVGPGISDNQVKTYFNQP